MPVHLHLRRFAVSPAGCGWLAARLRIAEAALAGYVYAPVGWATHYHADYVVPYWASTLAKNAIVGAHIFYRWAGEWGQPAIFSKAYAGREPNATALRNAALAADARDRRPAARASPQAIDEHPGRGSDQARPVDAWRQARRGALQPRRAQGVGRGDARGLCQEVRSFGQPQICAVERDASPTNESRSARRRRRRSASGSAAGASPSCRRGCRRIARRELQLDAQPDPSSRPSIAR